MFKEVARVVLYKSHSVMRQQVSMYGFVHVLPLPVVRSYWLCPKQKSLPSLRGWGDMFWKGGSPGCPLCGPVPVNGMVYVIQSCSNSLALAPVIKQSFLFPGKSDGAHSGWSSSRWEVHGVFTCSQMVIWDSPTQHFKGSFCLLQGLEGNLQAALQENYFAAEELCPLNGVQRGGVCQWPVAGFCQTYSSW